MAFSSVSLTLAIFCLVASNAPLCLSVVTIQLIYTYLHIQEVTAEIYIYFKRGKIIHCWLSVYMHLDEKCIFVTYLWNTFTDAMNFVRYEVKSASRNMTHAFGKITSVVWIQSLWQPTANDTGGNFFRQWRWAKLLSAGAANWQIGTKSRLEEINAWRQKYCCWFKSVYALLQNVAYPLKEREHRDTSKHMHQSQKPKAASSLSAAFITTIHVRMCWWQWRVFVYQNSPPLTPPTFKVSW